MRAIQDVGLEIFNKQPAKFYAFLGSEYGIKCKYIDMISEVYSHSIIEADSVKSIISLMRTKHLIPLNPCLYVVRYDEEFVSSLTTSSQSELFKLNMIGTLVVIYQSEKHCHKLAKYLPDICVDINQVDVKFVHKYLTQDYPDLSPRLIKLAAYCGADYGHAKNIGKCMSVVSSDKLNQMSDNDICKLFGKVSTIDEAELKVHIAAKDTSFLMANIPILVEDIDSIFYAILSTMTEFDKIWGNKYSDSPIKQFQKYWTREDMYYMFMHTYHQLLESRTSSVNKECQLIHLFTLLSISPIPSIDIEV